MKTIDLNSRQLDVLQNVSADLTHKVTKVVSEYNELSKLSSVSMMRGAHLQTTSGVFTHQEHYDMWHELITDLHDVAKECTDWLLKVFEHEGWKKVLMFIRDALTVAYVIANGILRVLEVVHQCGVGK